MLLTISNKRTKFNLSTLIFTETLLVVWGKFIYWAPEIKLSVEPESNKILIVNDVSFRNSLLLYVDIIYR